MSAAVWCSHGRRRIPTFGCYSVSRMSSICVPRSWRQSSVVVPGLCRSILASALPALPRSRCCRFGLVASAASAHELERTLELRDREPLQLGVDRARRTERLGERGREQALGAFEAGGGEVLAASRRAGVAGAGVAVVAVRVRLTAGDRVLVVVDGRGRRRRAGRGGRGRRGRRSPPQEPKSSGTRARIGTSALSTPSKVTMSVSSSGPFRTTPPAPLWRGVAGREGHAEAGLRRQVSRHAVLVVPGDFQRRRRARQKVDDRGIDRDAVQRRRNRHIHVHGVAHGHQPSGGVEARGDQFCSPIAVSGTSRSKCASGPGCSAITIWSPGWLMTAGPSRCPGCQPRRRRTTRRV